MKQLTERKLKKSGKKPGSRRKSKPRKRLKKKKKPEKRPKSGKKRLTTRDRSDKEIDLTANRSGSVGSPTGLEQGCV
jgi:hypothetical protein